MRSSELRNGDVIRVGGAPWTVDNVLVENGYIDYDIYWPGVPTPTHERHIATNIVYLLERPSAPPPIVPGWRIRFVDDIRETYDEVTGMWYTDEQLTTELKRRGGRQRILGSRLDTEGLNYYERSCGC